MFSTFARVCLALDNYQPMILNPFTRALSRMVTVPRSPIRCDLRTFVPYHGLLINGQVVRVYPSNLLVAFSSDACMFKASNSTLGLRRACPNVCRFIRRIGNLRIFQQRSVLVIGLGLCVNVFIASNMDATASLRTDSPINQVVRLIR